MLPPAILAQTEAIKHELFRLYGLKGALRSPSHITLHRPFEFKTHKENVLKETLHQFSHTPISIELSGFNCFEPRVIFIDVKPNPELELLHKQLTIFAKRNLLLFNEADDLRGFHPHVTLSFRDLKKNKFAEVYEYFRDKTFEAQFIVPKIALLKLNTVWQVIDEF